MSKKHYFVIVFFMFVFSIVQATPDRRRYVIDNLIGLHGKNIIVHQIVYDNLQSHDNHLVEEYLIEKYMENGNTIIIDMIKINKQDKIANLLLEKFNGNVTHIFPDIVFNNEHRIPDNEYIEIPSEQMNRYYLKEYIPKELIDCTIIRIVDIYFIQEYIYLTVDLRDDINIYRKIIMIKYL